MTHIISYICGGRQSKSESRGWGRGGEQKGRIVQFVIEAVEDMKMD